MKTDNSTNLLWITNVDSCGFQIILIETASLGLTIIQTRLKFQLKLTEAATGTKTKIKRPIKNTDLNLSWMWKRLSYQLKR